jgi:hypothetical protein
MKDPDALKAVLIACSLDKNLERLNKYKGIFWENKQVSHHMTTVPHPQSTVD